MKNFWKSYFRYYRQNKGYLVFVVVTYIILVTVLSFFVPSKSGIIAGCLFGDPFAFWIHNYRKVKAAQKSTCQHEPLLEVNGRPVYGTKCCSKCGLNEAYWHL